MASPSLTNNTYLINNLSRDLHFKRENILSNESNIILSISCKKNIIVAWKDISHLEAIGNYTMFYFTDGKKLLVSRTMKVFLPKLDAEMFVRIHKSFTINLNYVSQFDIKEEMFVQLRDGSKISISRRKKKEFIDRVRKHFGYSRIS
ncbi:MULTISPECIES: LytTR family DNA-binding domain-containing protein [Arcicella]|uniref:LytTR family DNA-binding domain-containing protein n=1 Tax=Arcicella aquatica TaxID=217141 RepID=A0ABU5QTL4_9BACT|nr:MULTISPECIES: LytTR family DNA-binding domain-containing protein [Arcicella]MDR6564301.1 DNA-binding LytR/AlgR family response regulator [Arcicella sp. BE51]MDR6814052.1 DNA-binding LytR/AlgR family response regulator [Arcicella sp. BE140]MDR6825364.1 DNA-binding LytR/AlgR family response regulator [Arcicella sp. BE139]MEA5260064.1 LytTR family DNA-binding domain-containing protein [Arcicella aquatica]